MINAKQSSETQNPSQDRDQDEPDDQGAPPQPNSRQQLEEISKLIRGDDGDDQDDADQVEQPKNAKPRQLRNVADVAKALGLEIEQVYDLEIPLRVANGEKKAIKLSELKDYHDGQDDHKLERLAWEEERSKEHADIARSRAELAELLAMVPQDKLNPDVLNKIRQRHDGLVSLERKKTLQRIPAWQDEDRRASELEGIAEHLADYGFPANALQGIADHRMLAYMRDNWLRKQRLTSALEKVKPVRNGSPPRSKAAAKAPGKTPVRPQAGARSVDTQVSAISKLLRGS